MEQACRQAGWGSLRLAPGTRRLGLAQEVFAEHSPGLGLQGDAQIPSMSTEQSAVEDGPVAEEPLLLPVKGAGGGVQERGWSCSRWMSRSLSGEDGRHSRISPC